MIRKAFVTLLIGAFVLGCQTVPVTGRKQLRLVPSSEMQAMSYSQYSEFLKTNKISRDAEKTAMVKKVGNRIQKAVETYMAEKGLSKNLSGFKWEFNLVDDNTVNAWCMPGGKVVFYTGILPICQTEEGIAIVMGHEVAHAIAEHGAERMSQGLVQQGVGTAVSVATMQKSPQIQQIYNTAFGVGSQVGMLKFSRQHESEADKIGLVFSAMAGYDPREAPKFWERMSSNSGGQAPPEFLSTHPSHDRRISDLKAQLPEAIQIYNKYKGKY